MDLEAQSESPRCCCAVLCKLQCFKEGECGERCHKAQDSCVSCWVNFLHFLNHVRMVFVRSIFFVFSIMSIWTVVEFRGNLYWLLLLSVVPLVAECIISLKLVKKKLSLTSKWFSPVVFVFLLSACPSIWLMELHIYEERSHTSSPTAHNNSLAIYSSQLQNLKTLSQETTFFDSSTVVFEPSALPTISDINPTNVPVSTVDLQSTLSSTISNSSSLNTMSSISSATEISISNSTEIDTMNNSEPSAFLTEAVTESSALVTELSSSRTFGITSSTGTSIVKDYHPEENNDEDKPLSFNKISGDLHFELSRIRSFIFGKLGHEDRARLMEQLLLLTLIVGRWLLPKGDITRDELSQLLLVNIGMAADIIELFEAYREDAVRTSKLLTTITLCLWQGSLLQFTLTKTATKGKKNRAGFSGSSTSDKPKKKKCSLTNCLCCETELWAIFTSLFLQDFPFFVFRMTLIFKFNVLSYSNVFFTCKNTLVILLQLYRISVIVVEYHTSKDEKKISPKHKHMNKKRKRMSKDTSFGVDSCTLTDFDPPAPIEKYVIITLKESNRRGDYSEDSFDYYNGRESIDLDSADSNSLPRPSSHHAGFVYKRRRRAAGPKLPTQKSLQSYDLETDESFQSLLPSKPRSKSFDVMHHKMVIANNQVAQLPSSSSAIIALPEILDETEETG